MTWQSTSLGPANHTASLHSNDTHRQRELMAALTDSIVKERERKKNKTRLFNTSQHQSFLFFPSLSFLPNQQHSTYIAPVVLILFKCFVSNQRRLASKKQKKKIY